MKRAFVAGHPVSQSRSPKIHTHWLETLGIDGAYEAIDVAPGGMAAHFARIRSGEFAGGNITVPLKEEALGAVDRLTPLAARIGAVNTVWAEEGEIWGDNTDITGFALNLSHAAPDWTKARSVLVAGAGGAARAVVLAVLERTQARIMLLNRTMTRAGDVAALAPGRIDVHPLDAFASHVAHADLVINTTSLGMAGKADAAGCPGAGSPFDFSAARPGALATDIVYVPLQTPFLAAAAAHGLRTVDGLGMLLHQAAPGFQRWFGVLPAVTPQLRALIEADLFGPASQTGRQS
ncbi:MAG: shikimate dehydrogenase [Rhizobiaceae bacterium]|jgi:shikimate dehydrogenase|nr:shikimate dehydrogenase [Rhizobiaceae bacterium]